MKNFNNQTHETYLPYLSYLPYLLTLLTYPTYFELIFIWSWFETIYRHFLQKLLAYILDKSCSKWDLLVFIFIHYKIINLDSITNKNNKKHNEKRPYIPDHPYRVLIIGGSGSGKTNTLLNLINERRYWQNLFACKRFKWTKV